jgi:hypothetical protein
MAQTPTARTRRIRRATTTRRSLRIGVREKTRHEDANRREGSESTGVS